MADAEDVAELGEELVDGALELERARGSMDPLDMVLMMCWVRQALPSRSWD